MKPFSKRSLLLSLCCAMSLFAQSAFADLDQLRHTGVLKVAVYNDMQPFSGKSGGIDVDFANALGKKLGLRVNLLPFDAGENLDDDLRNMVWKGHYLGYGPADVMMHVPVDRRLMAENKKVSIFAPYYRDRVRLVRNARAIPDCESVDCLVGKRVGAEKVSIAAMVLLGEQGGKVRDSVKIYDTAAAALAALKAGELDAVLANQSEIESVVHGDAGFPLSDLFFARLPRQGWVVGMAVRQDDVELARALQAAVNEMEASGELAQIFAKYGVTQVKP
ncbi:substrate-binding periplasmic protein [Noviherbaspirillum autotrophicum]|uniref:Amino acid ABC transporter substrate-binding protein n=1 Tax=Noviherbaspirillum autotrophicum TaxID=709839 RepID=A0A0C2BST0_9BURK|nr:transporter substrate-binding domain-containing protein [Noviherbaspirillum autotrophicum]KIF83119.1 amino acid ABC transporter substrate-binding protein [Noviherbaspirillum autotrophicum]